MQNLLTNDNKYDRLWLQTKTFVKQYNLDRGAFFIISIRHDRKTKRSGLCERKERRSVGLSPKAGRRVKSFATVTGRVRC